MVDINDNTMTTSKAYRFYKKRLQRIVESTNVKVDEKNINQIKTYEREPVVEMIITEPVAPALE